MTIKISSGEGEKKDLADKFSKLRDLRIAFSSGRDWNPADQFEQLRDEGFVEGSYLRVSWRRTGEFHVEER